MSIFINFKNKNYTNTTITVDTASTFINDGTVTGGSITIIIIIMITIIVMDDTTTVVIIIIFILSL